MSTQTSPQPSAPALDRPDAAPATRRRGTRGATPARWSLPILLLIMVIGFGILRPSEFLVWSNAQAILLAQSVGAIVALAAVVPLIAGEIDVSIGANAGFTSVFVAWAFEHHWGIAAAIAAALTIGLLIGALNSLLIVRIGINSFIATLATTTLLEGGNVLVTGGDSLFQGIPNAFPAIGQNSAVGVPLLTIYCLVIAAVLWYLISFTPFGRRLRATGSGREAARLIGVRTPRYAVSALLIAGLIAGAAGILETAKLASAEPSAGTDLLLPAIAAVFLGATISRRNHVNIWGTLIAVLTLAVGITGLTMIGAPIWVPDVFNGVALILALVASRWRSEEGSNLSIL